MDGITDMGPLRRKILAKVHRVCSLGREFLALGIEQITARNIDSLHENMVVFVHPNDMSKLDSCKCTKLFVVELDMSRRLVEPNITEHRGGKLEMRVLKPILDL